MKEMKEKESKLLSGLKKKYQTETKMPSVKKQTMNGILDQVNALPGKIAMTEKYSQSVLKSKKDENPLHGGQGKNF